MPRVTDGFIVECDPALKQYLIYLSNEMDEGFILQDVDSKRLFVRGDENIVEDIQTWIRTWNDKNSYAVADQIIDEEEDDD